MVQSNLIQSYMKLFSLCLSALLALVPLTTQAGDDTLKIMSFNIWRSGGKSLPQTIEVIRQSGADAVGLQETDSVENITHIAQQLGWNFFYQGSHTGIISQHKIIGSTPKKWGVKLEAPNGQQYYLFNVHLAPWPYQPYQLLGIPYKNAPFFKTAEEAVISASKARSGQVSRLLAEINAIKAEKLPIFITGDFNEPSCLDWTAATVEKKTHPVVVEWPSTRTILDAGFIDTYRTVYPDPVKNPGFTWTPTTRPDDPKDHHDRIDLVLAGGVPLTVKSVKIVGENKKNADIVIESYPSDHRAVLAEVVVK